MNRRLVIPATCGLALALALLTAATATLASGLVDDDAEERAEARHQAEQAFAENCLMCHTAELTTRQRLNAKQWTAEVEKMIGWGAPLPPERKEGLIALLAADYPPGRPVDPPARMTPAAALATDQQEPPGELMGADPARGATLFAQNCAACHGPAARGGEVGVNLVAKPILVRPDEFHDLLRQGRRRMPSFAPIVDPKGQADLLAYLRQQR